VFLADRFVTSLFAFSGFGPTFPRVHPIVFRLADACFQTLNYDRKANFSQQKTTESNGIQQQSNGKQREKTTPANVPKPKPKKQSETQRTKLKERKTGQLHS